MFNSVVKLTYIEGGVAVPSDFVLRDAIRVFRDGEETTEFTIENDGKGGRILALKEAADEVCLIYQPSVDLELRKFSSAILADLNDFASRVEIRVEGVQGRLESLPFGQPCAVFPDGTYLFGVRNGEATLIEHTPLPQANKGDILQFNGSDWVAVNPKAVWFERVNLPLDRVITPEELRDGLPLEEDREFQALVWAEVGPDRDYPAYALNDLPEDEAYCGPREIYLDDVHASEVCEGPRGTLHFGLYSHIGLPPDMELAA